MVNLDWKVVVNLTVFSTPPAFDVNFFRESNYISEVLEINDTLFVQKQFELNKTFNFDDLSKFGFKILDVKSIIEIGGGYNEIFDEVNLL